MEGLLTGPQLDKFERVKKYLAISVPNEWRTLAELDHVLSSGAQLVRFPWDWVRLLKDATRDSTYGIQMRLPSIASGQGKEAIALRFSSLKFANQEELIGALNSPYNASSSTKTNTSTVRSPEDNENNEQVSSSRIECVGTNTQSLAQGDALTEHIVRQAIASQSILYVSNSSGGLAKRFQRRGDGAVGGGGGEDDADGEGTGGGALDGGRSRLSQWLTRAPLGVLRSSLKTRRGIIETSYGGAGIPLSIREGEEMIMRVQRQDDSANRARYDRGGLFGTAASSGANENEGGISPTPPYSHPKGTLIILSLLVNDMIPSSESNSGVVVGPCDLAFNADGQLADIKVTARKKGSYILNFKVTVQSPNTDAYSGLSSEQQERETVYECSIRLIVKEVFSYSHALNHANIVKVDVCDLPNAVQPGGVALFRSDLFPLAVPREYCLSTFTESSFAPNQQIAQHNQKVRAALQGGAAAGGGSGGNQQHQTTAQHQMPRPLSWWWCDISPNLSALAEVSRPEAAELKACASMAMEGAFLFRSVLDTSVGGGVAATATSESGNWDASYRDADGNLDAAKVQRKLQEEARERAEKAKALAARRLKKKQRNRELTNTHLLNYGIDLRKPFRK